MPAPRPRPAHPIVVAIDGPAGAGKSTAARRLAGMVGYRLLDTGALYRTVALLARRRGTSWDDEPALAAIAAGLDVEFRLDDMTNRLFVDGEDLSSAIRTPEVSQGSSIVSALPGVRAALLGLQRRLGGEGGVVAEGRDVGTVVFPSAGAKFFLTASDEVRAQRRQDELRAAGVQADFQSTMSEMQRRDQRDATRQAAPLVCAPDAVVLDSSALTIDEVVKRMFEVVKEREVGTG
ncbi:MAG TPA: (d)CMP kinase [Kofleriaceae bacterium]|nr:(d)CMP kinase [Kofleriaceae bacterium]